MPKHWFIDTNADRDTALRAFSSVFFTRPAFKDRLKLSKGAQLRSQQIWGQVRPDGDGDIAAVLERGGMREAVASSSKGTGSQLGTTVTMAFYDEGGGRSTLELWLSYTNTFMGFSQNNDVLKAYTKLVAAELANAGFSASAKKG